jgi:hypothetical protein
MIRPLPRDIENTTIQGSISGIPEVQEISTLSGEWSSIVLDTEECKKIILQPRAQIDWLFSTSSGGQYFTFHDGAALAAPVVTTSGTTICWVKPASDVVFELLIGG